MACDGQGAATDSIIFDYGWALMICFPAWGLSCEEFFIFLLDVRFLMRRSYVKYLLPVQPEFFDETNADLGGLCQDSCTSRAPRNCDNELFIYLRLSKNECYQNLEMATIYLNNQGCFNIISNVGVNFIRNM